MRSLIPKHHRVMARSVNIKLVTSAPRHHLCQYCYILTTASTVLRAICGIAPLASCSFLVREVTEVVRWSKCCEGPQLAYCVPVRGHWIKVKALFLVWPGEYLPPPHFYRKNDRYSFISYMYLFLRTMGNFCCCFKHSWAIFGPM